MTAKRFKKIIAKNWVALGILLSTWLVFFSRTITTKYVYFLDDLKIIFYPLEWAYAQFQSTGDLPLWSNYFGFGHPLLAWGQLGFFTPLHLLLRVISIHPLTILQISIVFYFGIGSLGMYWFLRSQKISPIASVLGATIFTYSGFHIGHLNHVNFYTTTMLLPWLLLLLYRLSIKPSLSSSLPVVIIAAIMTVSGQPQMVLYSFIVAALWLATLFFKTKSRIFLSLCILGIGLLAFCLASLAILPLAEFISATDRADGLSATELLEFSYPPHHVITLLLPYYFGDHNYYWGAKSFQELSAYIGIIPLLLVGVSLFFFRKYRSLKVFGLILLFLGIVFCLGRFSPLYYWLVSIGVIKSIAIPGRFVFLFIIGSSVLAPIGLDNIVEASTRNKIISLVISIVFLLVLFSPFYLYIQTNPNALSYFLSSIALTNFEPILILLGLVAFLPLVFASRSYIKKFRFSYILVILSSITLIAYGWNYTPLTAKDLAYTQSTFIPTVQDYSANSLTPARLYQLQHQSISDRRRTEPISPSLTIHQPIISRGSTMPCLTIPFKLSRDSATHDIVEVALSRGILDPPLRTTAINLNNLTGSSFDVCFDQATVSDERMFLSFTSKGNSGMRLIHQPNPNQDLKAFLVRVDDPSLDQIDRSRKDISIVYSEHGVNSFDRENQQLARHLNVTADASSANWIGALAIGPFRSFVSSLLDDDFDPAHYNSQDIISDSRKIIDLAGITHIVETALIDTDYEYLESSGFKYVSEIKNNNINLRLHMNPSAYPKAWLSKQAIFSPVANETIAAMRRSDFEPRDLVYISGPTPPKKLGSGEAAPLQSTVNITRYDPTVIDINVTTNQLSWLVLTDSTTPQWQTYIDGKLAPQYEAFTFFKAAQVPAGDHVVSFRYESKITNIAVRLTNTALLILIVLIVLSAIRAPRMKKG
jgi:hypothetical protein